MRNKIVKIYLGEFMKKLILALILSALVFPAMADTSKDLEKILANKELKQEITSALEQAKTKEKKQEPIFYFEKADIALNILIQENEQLLLLLERVKQSHKNLMLFLTIEEYVSEEEFRKTCKDLFYYLDALALDIWEIQKIDKNLAGTIEKIVDHPYYVNALALEVNISALNTLVLKYYKPSFYYTMTIAQSALIKEPNKTGYDKKWEDFIDKFLASRK